MILAHRIIKTTNRRSSIQSLADHLRQIVVARNQSGYAVSTLTAERFDGEGAVESNVITRFLVEDRDTRLETAAKLATFLRLRLIESGPVRGRGRRE